jgi:hypothetical protein
MAPKQGDTIVVAFFNNGGNDPFNTPCTYTAPDPTWSEIDKDDGTHQAAGYESFSHVVGAADTGSYLFGVVPQGGATACRQSQWMHTEISGAAGVDAAKNSYAANTPTFTSTSMTPASINDLAIVFDLPFLADDTQTWSNPAGWNQVTPQGSFNVWPDQELTQSFSTKAPVSETATFSTTAPQGFSAVVLLKP